MQNTFWMGWIRLILLGLILLGGFYRLMFVLGGRGDFFFFFVLTYFFFFFFFFLQVSGILKKMRTLFKKEGGKYGAYHQAVLERKKAGELLISCYDILMVCYFNFNFNFYFYFYYYHYYFSFIIFFFFPPKPSFSPPSLFPLPPVQEDMRPSIVGVSLDYPFCQKIRLWDAIKCWTLLDVFGLKDQQTTQEVLFLLCSCFCCCFCCWWWWECPSHSYSFSFLPQLSLPSPPSPPSPSPSPLLPPPPSPPSSPVQENVFMKQDNNTSSSYLAFIWSSSDFLTPSMLITRSLALCPPEEEGR